MKIVHSASVRKRVSATLLAVALAAGSIVLGATAAQAAQPQNCSTAATVPVKSGSQIKGSGTGTCTAKAQRVWKYELHRSEGWWHPTVGTFSWTGSQTNYSGSVTKCDPGSGTGTKQYFGQSFFDGYSAVLSGNSSELTICD